MFHTKDMEEWERKKTIDTENLLKIEPVLLHTNWASRTIYLAVLLRKPQGRCSLLNFIRQDNGEVLGEDVSCCWMPHFSPGKCGGKASLGLMESGYVQGHLWTCSWERSREAVTPPDRRENWAWLPPVLGKNSVRQEGRFFHLCNISV